MLLFLCALHIFDILRQWPRIYLICSCKSITSMVVVTVALTNFACPWWRVINRFRRLGLRNGHSCYCCYFYTAHIYWKGWINVVESTTSAITCSGKKLSPWPHQEGNRNWPYTEWSWYVQIIHNFIVVKSIIEFTNFFCKTIGQKTTGIMTMPPKIWYWLV